MPDKEIICVVCDNSFVLTIEKQQRYFDLGFEEPKRCPECLKRKRRHSKFKLTKNRKGKPRHRDRASMEK